MDATGRNQIVGTPTQTSRTRREMKKTARTKMDFVWTRMYAKILFWLRMCSENPVELRRRSKAEREWISGSVKKGSPVVQTRERVFFRILSPLFSPLLMGTAFFS